MEDFLSQAIPDPEPQPPATKPGGFRRFVLDVFETLLLSLVLFLGINAISARIRIESISMQPTLYAGNFVIVNKIAYFLNSPGRGDVIIFKYPPDPNREPYIKRIIGLPEIIPQGLCPITLRLQCLWRRHISFGITECH